MEAVAAQARRLCLSMPSAVYPEKLALAERLLALAPSGYTKVLFTLGGADANENALKMARMVTGRATLVARERSYHGATMGALSLSGDPRRHPAGPGLREVERVDDFACPRCPFGVRGPACDHAPLSHIPALLEGRDDVAAVFVESVVGANGVLIPPPGYLRAVRRACDQSGTLLVCDEVLTGFGRTGRWFAFGHFDDVSPDMITCGKALTGGYGTLGAVLVHERVAAHFEDQTLYCGLTGTAHPLGVAAALEALRVYEDEGLVARAADLAPTLGRGLQRIVDGSPAARQARALGLLGGVELTLDASGWKLLAHALAARRILAHVVVASGMLIVSPPLCIDEGDLEAGLSAVYDAVEEACP
jgi:taurine---2-oxoglutarate transaminase